jgi:hypothetical protein
MAKKKAKGLSGKGIRRKAIELKINKLDREMARAEKNLVKNTEDMRVLRARLAELAEVVSVLPSFVAVVAPAIDERTR